MYPLLETLFGFDVFMPVVWLFLAAVVCVSIELGAKDRAGAKLPIFYAALGGVLLAFVSLFNTWGGAFEPHLILNGGVMIDRFGLFLCAGVLIGTALCCFTGLVLVAASGMLLLVTSYDLIMIFLSVELMSLAIYVLAGINRSSGRSAEAAMKYFVMGAFASGFLVLGMALIYGVTQTISLAEIGDALAAKDNAYRNVAMLGIGMVVIGFAFKVGAVPFHQWVPDVYTGAPTPVTGFMAVAVKFAAFGALGRFVVEAFPDTLGGEKFSPFGMGMFWAIAALSMVIGNWLAVTQENVKRMLAYSSIAHSGYLLMGIVAMQAYPDSLGSSDAMSAILFYLLVYAFGTGGAFALLTWTATDSNEDGGDLRGLAKRSPGMALAMSIFMLSLAGIPLTGGFIGKYMLFSSAIEAGEIWLAVIGILASIVGAFYYLRVIVLMYMKDPTPGEAEAKNADDWGVRFALLTASIATVVLGLMPNPFVARAENASVTISAPQQPAPVLNAAIPAAPSRS
ncbi:MAG: NADH-quinone oxidoreductase subunit N [Planctomycetes bacterium]|nr:NADH-quinone oxidoreductase subunit N [Planctomycetota bacterium]